MDEKEYRIAGITRDSKGRPTGFKYEEERWDEEYNVFLPYSSLRDVWIYTGDQIFQASEAFPTRRLDGVRHLALLAWTGSEPDKIYPHEFSQTRFLHTLLVSLIVERILRKNGIDQKEINAAVAAAVLHDIATPAGGDPVKSVDPANLDEESFWWEVLEEKGWNYLDSIGADRNDIDKIIKNKGYRGEVLDIADRIHYVVNDLFNLIGNPNLRVHFPGEIPYSQIDKAYGELEREVLKDPLIGEIYKDVMIDLYDQVYFTDPERLGRFLKIRALLFKHLYANPFSQGKDLKLASLVSQFYSSDDQNKDKLTPSKLRRMTDEKLFRWLVDVTRTGDIYPSPDFLYRVFVDWSQDCRYDRFDNPEQAKARAEEIKGSSLNMHVVGIREFKGFDSGTGYKVMDAFGKLVEFREYDPAKASEIEEISESTKGVFVFYEGRAIQAELENLAG